MIFDAGTSKGASRCKSKYSDDSTDTDDYFNGVHKKRIISDGAAVEDEEVCSSNNASAPIELTRYLPGFSSKKRKSLLTLSKDATNDFIVKFTSLIDARKNNKPVFDEEATVDRIMDIMLNQSHGFVQSVGVDIDYTDLVTFFQSYFKNNTDSESQHENNVQSEKKGQTKSNSPEVCEDPDSKKRFTDDNKQIDDQPMKEIRKLPNCSESESKASGRCGFKCNDCNRTFRDYRGLGGHRASHSRNNRSTSGIMSSFKCQVCGAEFNSCQAYGGHVAGHNRKKRLDQQTEAGTSNSEGQKSYPCNICKKKFASGQALGGHKTCHRNPAENFVVQESSDQAAQQPVLLPESCDQVATQEPSLLPENSDQGTSSSQKPDLLPDLNGTPND